VAQFDRLKYKEVIAFWQRTIGGVKNEEFLNEISEYLLRKNLLPLYIKTWKLILKFPLPMLHYLTFKFENN
jgi:hypothetical protein